MKNLLFFVIKKLYEYWIAIFVNQPPNLNTYRRTKLLLFVEIVIAIFRDRFF